MPRRTDSARPSTTQGRLVARHMLFSIGPAMPKQALATLAPSPISAAASARNASAIPSSEAWAAEGYVRSKSGMNAGRSPAAAPAVIAS